MVKNPPADPEDTGSIPGLGRSPGEGNGNPLPYSCLENPMDRGAWRATVHGVAKSQTRLKRQHSVQPGDVLSVMTVGWRPGDTAVGRLDPRAPTQWPGASVGPAPQSTLGQRPPPQPRDADLPEGAGPVAQRAALSSVHYPL